MKLATTFIFGCLLLILFGCDKQIEEGVMKSDLTKDVEMITDYGTIIMRLSDETPMHRNNFIKLVSQKFYDSIAFHRVLENFVIQGGNPTTKPSEVFKGDGDPELSYTIEAEIKPNLFHKRGALGAARTGHIFNRNRLSSGFQFYIVQRGPYVDSTLNIALEKINKQIAFNNVINIPTISTDIDEYVNLKEKLDLLNKENYTEKDTLLLNSLKSKIDLYNIDSLANNEFETIKKYELPEAHREVYKTIGGAPHLDQNYTIFGEVVKGMNIVDSIAGIKTNDDGKPINDVRIISGRMIKRISY
ncbi:peptidylprolyl isomerase [Wocania ichthyoenteri]|uniref:peptidylprolyl isomerase n=1 Tax=Wocania ichthyoenteri TaxID=1230531 RepID=UPI00053DC10C|nr:peptidylprolyl isomerase [Wocania ichthyoenteri]